MTVQNGIDWRVVGASVQGVGHLKSDTPCQDAHRFVILPGGLLLAVVADGAGSAELAAQGSQFAADCLVDGMSRDEMQPYLNGEVATMRPMLEAAFSATRQLLEEKAALAGHDPKDYSTTVLLVIASPSWIAVAQVGDGAVVVEDRDGSVLALTTPQIGEHANETIFLVSPGAIEQAEFVVWRGAVKNVAAFTDGLQRLALKLPEGAAHAPFFAPLFQFTAEMDDATAGKTQLESFLRSPRITERADDDLTLLLAHCNNPSF